MSFKSLLPCEYLKPYINSYWILDVSDNNYSFSAIFPPLSHNGLVFNYSPFYSIGTSKEHKNMSTKCVFGAIFADFYSLNLRGSGGFLGVLFKPGILAHLFNINMSEIGEKEFDAELLIGSEITDVFLQMQEVLSLDLKIKIIERYLINKVKIKKTVRRPADNVIGLINEKKGNIKIEEISNYFNLSTRQLERHFNQIIGISPKKYSAIIKFNAILNQLKNFEKTNWCDLAFDGGYYDQQHLIHTFSKFTGLPPSKYIKQVNFIHGHISNFNFI